MKQNIKLDLITPNTGSLDFSWLLDAPAGKHGFVRVKNSRLAFEDGSPAKFIGFNLPGRANFPDHAGADLLVGRLASLGVNLVRICAPDICMDRLRGSDDPMRLIDYTLGDSRHLYEPGLERLDYFIDRLKQAGIYVHIDLMVWRAFMEGDGLDYPNPPTVNFKSATFFNYRLIELQKEFATKYLTRKNRYTGLALVEDPVVMAIQMSNENSVMFEASMLRQRFSEGLGYYTQELQRRFNYFLLSKYDNRRNLAKAWTFEGQCALAPEEDPTEGTVRVIPMGDYYQPMNEPMGDWAGEQSPPRYADYVEFSVWLNQKYYTEMIDHVRGLGAKMPLTNANLYTGAADIYSASNGDFMENNAYFNHPSERHGHIEDVREYVASDPRKLTFPGFERRSNLITQLASTAVKGKPFTVCEWNEYGAYPFHSSSYLMQAAYACLQQWDMMMMYAFHHTDDVYEPTDDFIESVFDIYNDPSLICEFGTMSAIFLKDLVRPARNSIELCHTMESLLTQPSDHRMPYSYLPFVSKMRTHFMTNGSTYEGDADVVVTSGFTSSGDFRQAKHAVIYAHSPYIDARRTGFLGKAYLDQHRGVNALPLGDVGTLSDTALVVDRMSAIAENGDYSGFAAAVDTAMKRWGLTLPGQGLVEERMFISDTGQLIFNPTDGWFRIHAPGVEVFTGKPDGEIRMGNLSAVIQNDRLTLTVLAQDAGTLECAERFIITGMGASGNDADRWEGTRFIRDGKLYVDTWQGSLTVSDCVAARLIALDVYGNPLQELKGVSTQAGVIFRLDGELPSVNFQLLIKR